MGNRQDQFFQAVASRQIPRIRVAAIVVDNGEILVQRPADDPSSCYAFIGGEYEVGDSFETRLKLEFEEETNARVLTAEYLFCVENRFRYKDHLIQQLEHFFLVSINRRDIASREPHLQQHWLPISDLPKVDLRPMVVRDAISANTYLSVRHLIQMQS